MLIDDAKAKGDPRTKLFLYTAPESADPFAEATIKLANPAFGDFQNASEVRDQAESARRMPSRESAYRNLILNQRVNMTNPFVSRSVWDACGGEVDPEAFEKGDVFVGLDLSMRNDLTAAVAVAKDADGVWQVECHFFAPQVGVSDRAHKDRAPYDVWARDGFITLTPGASVDYGFVAEWLAEFCSTRNVVSVRFDRWRIDVLKAELARIGADLPLEPFGQGFRDMTPALDAVEAELTNDNIRHGGNPVLTMCAANAVATRDAAGNRKLDKSKATGRIDGMVALAMAMGAASIGGQQEAPVDIDDYLANIVIA
ncbi:MAG: terminase TerL endonuclease subunit [Luteimonas sp.]